jgi:hypothetical protein
MEASHPGWTLQEKILVSARSQSATLLKSVSPLDLKIW